MSTRVMVNGRAVGDTEPTFVIAEAGSNHDQKLSQAKELIEVASDCGADAVKFQLFHADSLYDKKDKAFSMVKACELPHEWLPKLAAYAKKRKIIFLVTPFDKKSVNLLEQINIPAYKWGSSETTNLSLLKYAAANRKPMLISTGMCNFVDVCEAVEVIRSCQNDQIVLMQCTSLYPTPPERVHLRVMDTLKDAFRVPVGLSDHTTSTAIPVAAVARGACVIEKHYTLSRTLKGPDHSYALEPGEFEQMVRAIREVEKSLGSDAKEALPEELKFARRTSIIAKNLITRGTTIRDSMVEVKRPGSGIAPRYLQAVIGSIAKCNIQKGKPLTWEFINNTK